MRLQPRHHFRLLAILPAVACLACDSDSPVKPEPVSPPVWSEITNLPPSITLYGLWAPRDDLVIGVGKTGNIWQWDGQRWTQRLNSSAADLFAIAGSTAGSVVAVGDGGTALEQVNGFFIPRDAMTIEDLRGVWRSESGLFVAAGAGGAIIRGNGSTWSRDPTPTSAALFSVWGSGESDLFAVGVGGTILHHDGVEWTTMASGTPEILSAVSGTSANDVYAVGGAGTVLHYDGVQWTPMASGTTDLLQSICPDCGPAAAGANGTVLRLVGGAWQREKITGAPWLYATARAGNDQWAVGAHALFRHNGTIWLNENRGTVPILRGITSSSATGVIAVGDNGRVLLGGPDRWRNEDAGAIQRLNAVYASPDGEIFAAGTNRIFRRTDTGWVVENSDIVEYFDIGGNAEHVLAVGTDGAIRERQGGAWFPIRDSIPVDLHAVRMTESAGYIAGNNGYVLVHNGASWQVTGTRSSAALWDIMPVETTLWRAIAVGAGGVSLGRATDGTGWYTMSTDTPFILYTLARGPDGYLFAAGANGTVLRYVDDRWTAVQGTPSRTFMNAWPHDGALYLCGGSTASGGFIFRYGPPAP